MNYGSAKQTLLDNGYSPIPVMGKKPALDNWRENIAPEGYGGYNAGILCGSVVAIDIDITDKEIAEQLKDYVLQICGETVYRIGRAPKVLLVYRNASPEGRKRVSKRYDCGRIEVLGEGQQFVAFGTHPDTKQPYTWPGPLGNLLDIRIDSLPQVNDSQITDILHRFEEIAEKAGYRPVSKESELAKNCEYDPTDPLDRPEIIQDLTIDRCKKILASIDPDCSRDEWRNLGMSLHYQFKGSPEALALWDEWSAKGTKYKSGEPEKQWESFGQYSGRPLSGAYLLKQEKKVDAWTLEGVNSDWVFTPPKPFEFIIPNLLAKALVGFIYGSGGTYKSLAALWLVLQRASCKILPDQKWLDRFPVTPGKSIFFSAEDVLDDLHHRGYAILNSLIENDLSKSIEDLKPEISSNFRLIPREQWIADRELFLIDSEGIPTKKLESIIGFTNTFEADLILIETASRIAPIDENDNSMGARLVGCLEEIRDKTGACILVIDHSSKSTRGAKSDLLGQNSLRGASSKLDNARWGLLFETRKSEGGTDLLQISNSKSFRCRRADPFEVTVEYPRFSLVEKQEKKPDIYDSIIEAVQANPGIKRRDLIKMLSGASDKKSAAITRCTRDGFIRNEGEGYYYVED
ncbi:MAG: AAA family ATPase [Fibrobacter sp.]|nr:AAA family ATPase [Fibrobacter sp.]